MLICLPCAIACVAWYSFARTSPRTMTRQQRRSYNQKSENLFNDMNQYDTIQYGVHSGNVYQHGVWVARCIAHWFDIQHPWVEGIPSRYKKILVFAGFLHDIGKCGDHVYRFRTKPAHPFVGCEYIMGSRPYLLHDNTRFDIHAWLKDQGLSQEECTLVALITHNHSLFGSEVVKYGKPKSNNNKLFEHYYTHLKTISQELGYHNGSLDALIIRMAMLIGAADVKGFNNSSYNNFHESYWHPAWNASITPAHQSPNDMYQTWEFETKGLILKKQLLAYVTNNSKTNLWQIDKTSILFKDKQA